MFRLDIEEKLFDENIPSLGVEKMNTPAFLCGAGIIRMKKEFKLFPEQYRVNKEALEKENNLYLTGVDLI